jgi:F420-dependent oxidoreductase-like protein
MIEVAIMLEGQNGLNWPRWQRIAQRVEDLGYVGLYRSDHFTNGSGPDLDSLELWVSFTWLASHTKRIEFGPLVSPVSFRHPSLTARMAAAIDDLSGGRLSLGIGAGWNQREHEHFSFDLLDVPQRFKRFEEGVQVIKGLLQSDTPFDFTGEYYKLKEAILLPRPQRPGGPPILIGGNGVKLTLPLVAKYAAEWNAVYSSPAKFAENNAILDGLVKANGRDPKSVRRSMMTGCHFGTDAATIKRKIGDRDPAQMRKDGVVVGGPDDVLAQLKEFEAAGVQRIMLQWLELDDLAGLEAMAKGVLGQLG